MNVRSPRSMASDMSEGSPGLQQKTILVTRQAEQSQEFIAAIQERGGRALLFPMIRVTEPNSWAACDESIDRLPVYDGVIFTSTNAVHRFLGRCASKGVGVESLKGKIVIAVGSRTKLALEKEHVTVEYIPGKYSSAALGEYFTHERVQGKRFLFPRGNLSGDTIVRDISKGGGSVEAVTVYQTTPPDRTDAGQLRRQLDERTIDVVTFASPSAAGNFATLLGAEYLARLKRLTAIAAIGPTTSRALTELGISPDIVADESNVHGLVDAICAYFG